MSDSDRPRNHGRRVAAFHLNECSKAGNCTLRRQFGIGPASQGHEVGVASHYELMA